MVSERLEVRLDPEHRRKLSEVAAQRNLPIAETIRQMIDRSYGELDRDRRRAAVRRIGRLGVEDVPDPETLSKQLAETYAGPDLP